MPGWWIDEIGATPGVVADLKRHKAGQDGILEPDTFKSSGTGVRATLITAQRATAGNEVTP